jgi:hypothetical protein
VTTAATPTTAAATALPEINALLPVLGREAALGCAAEEGDADLAEPCPPAGDGAGAGAAAVLAPQETSSLPLTVFTFWAPPLTAVPPLVLLVKVTVPELALWPLTKTTSVLLLQVTLVLLFVVDVQVLLELGPVFTRLQLGPAAAATPIIKPADASVATNARKTFLILLTPYTL